MCGYGSDQMIVHFTWMDNKTKNNSIRFTISDNEKVGVSHEQQLKNTPILKHFLTASTYILPSFGILM